MATPYNLNSVGVGTPGNQTTGGISDQSINNFVSTLPQNLWGGTPLRNIFGVTPAYAAEQTPTPQVLGQSIDPYAAQGQSIDPNAGQVLKNNPVPAPNPNPNPTPSGPSAEDQLRSDISGIFDPVFSALSGQESTLNTNFGITNNDINQQFNTSSGTLTNQNVSGNQQLNQLGTEAGQTKTDAFTAATRLYSELSRGGQQRFGGASSAGEAYGALTAVEQQRRQGTIQTAYDGAMQKIGQYKNDLLTKFNDAVKELGSQKDTAIANARTIFNDAMQAIQNGRSQAQGDKATATMNTLQVFRNKVYTINMQGVQFVQSLAANKDISLKAVDNYTQQVIQSLTSGNNTLVGTQGLMSNASNATQYGKVGISAPAATTLQTGQINTAKPDYTKYPQNGYTA